MKKIVVIIVIFVMLFTGIASLIVENNSTTPTINNSITGVVHNVDEVSDDDELDTSVMNISLGIPTKTSDCSFDYLPYPDPSCTTGAIFPNLTKEDICWSGYSASVRNVPESLKNQVYANYGVVDREPNSFEIDHLVSLSLAGTNDISNLFPEKYNMTLGARTKDKVENCFHRKVCDGTLDLKLAQHIMATNWTEGMVMCGVTE